MTNNNVSKTSLSMLFFRNALLSAALGVLISLVFTLLLSVVLINIHKYQNFYPILTVLVQCLPSFVAGKLFGQAQRKSFLIIGLIEGIFMSVLLLSISLIVSGFNINYDAFLSSVPYIISSAVLGSVISGGKKKLK